MLRLTTHFSALTAFLCLSGSAVTQAGLLGCGCSHGPVHHAPAIYAATEMDADCGYAAAVPACCGVGGKVQLGSLYGSPGFYGGCHYRGYGPGYGGGYYGSPDPRSFESGFENLPNMDGGGVHHRLPFHSYRRPWAHPGIADNNINICW